MTSHEKATLDVVVKEEPHHSICRNAGALPPQPVAAETIDEGSAVVRSGREKRLLLKMDFVVLPMLTLSWFIAYLVSSWANCERAVGI